MKKIINILLIIMLLSLVVISNSKVINAEENEIISYEFDRKAKCVWVSAFVSDISRYNSKSQYQAQITTMLDNMVKNDFNILFFHIRVMNDALYKSDFSKWSVYYNTNPDWDALPWIIEECHKRGIEFHAWMNPYRVKTSYEDLTTLSKKFPKTNAASNPDNLLAGKSTIILNPGIPEVQRFLVNVCMEVVNNYDVDAIHFDDYFYVEGVDDRDTYIKYGNGQGIENFRRESIDKFIYDLHKQLEYYNKKNNKCVELGISPTAAWNNGDGVVTYDENNHAISTGSKGITQGHYDFYLYCDTLKWVNNEWIDYIVPQCYIGTSTGNETFYGTVDWWSKVCKYSKTKLYIGIGLYRAGGADWQDQDELLRQFKYMSKYDNINGFAIYSYKHLISTSSSYKVNRDNAKEYLEGYCLPPLISIPFDDEVNMLTDYYIYNGKIGFELLDDAKYYIILGKNTELKHIMTTKPYEKINVNSNEYSEFYIAPVMNNNEIGQYVKLSSQDKYEEYNFYGKDGEYLYSKYVKEEEELTLDEGVEIEGYDFIEWEIIGNNYYAKYEKKQFEVSYIVNGELVEVRKVGYGEDAPLIEYGTIYGVFSGWKGKYQNVTSDIELKGSYDCPKYVINYYDGTTLIKKEYYYKGTTVDVSLSLEKDGYDFLGFSNKGVIVSSFVIMENISLYAKYELMKPKYRIEYDLDGGYSNSLIYEFDDLDELLLAIPEKTGYVFIGWYEGDNLIEKVTYKDYQLKARYKKIYNIVLDNEENITFTDPTDVILPIKKKEGYKFIGWFDGINQVTDIGYQDYYLSSKFLKEYSISYIYEGDLSGELVYSFTELDTIVLPELTKEGYLFIGWFDGDNKIEVIYGDIKKDIILNGLFDKVYTIILDRNYDNLDKQIITFKQGENVVLPEISRDGYEFTGWFDALDRTKKVTVINNSDYELIALYTKVYNITYILNYPNNEGMSEIYSFSNCDDVELLIPSCAGYEFIGWFEKDNMINNVENKDYELIAKWEKANSGCLSGASLINIFSMLFVIMLMRKRRF